MAAGPTLLGVGYFAAVKIAGYTLAARCLTARAAVKPRQPAWVIGLARTLIGMFFGMTVLFVLGLYAIGRHEWLFFAVLLPVRLGEWLLLFALFYRESGWTLSRKFKLACLGIGWSFILDVPAFAAAFMIPGGFWIC